MDGYKITDMDQIRRDKFDLADIDRKLFEVFSEQIFNTGFVHADPHPGNGRPSSLDVYQVADAILNYVLLINRKLLINCMDVVCFMHTSISVPG